MAEKSSFFNSVSHDRRYSAEDWAAYFSSFISNGVFAKPSGGLQVMAAGGMTIAIKAGSGFINGYYYRNTTDLKKTLATADGVTHRIDRVVMRWSLIDRAIYIAVKRGAPSSTPVAPTLQRDAEVYELALGDVYIGAGITAVTQSNITDRRANAGLCGFVTGVIDQFDFSTFTTQFEAFFAEYRTQIRDDYDAYSTSMNDFEAAAQDDFTTWFDGIRHVLDGDAVGNLYNEISSVRDLTNLAFGTVKLHFSNTEVPVSAFKADTTYADFPFRAAVALSGALASMVPDIIFDAADAVSGNFAPVAKSYDGGIYLYAAEIPEKALTIPTILLWRTNADGGGGSPGSSAAAETYAGSYSVTPSFERQELETQGKVMRDNVVAEEIPVAIVSNTADGNTVIIGG